jgi:hypothetical protein
LVLIRGDNNAVAVAELQAAICNEISRIQNSEASMIRNTLKLGAKASGALIAGSFGYGYYLHETDVGARRAYTAYKTMIPVVLHYRLMEAKHNHYAPMSDKDWEAIDELYAVQTVSKLGELQGMYCKVR